MNGPGAPTRRSGRRRGEGWGRSEVQGRRPPASVQAMTVEIPPNGGKARCLRGRSLDFKSGG